MLGAPSRPGEWLAEVWQLRFGAPGSCCPTSAATFCVGKPACSGIDMPTLKTALDAANLPGNLGPDRVELGEGQFDGPAVVLKGSGAEIVGAGRGKTILVGKPAMWVLVSYDQNTHVSDLSIRMDDGNSTGIDGNEPGLLVELVDIQGPPENAASRNGIILRRGGTVRDDAPNGNLAPATLSRNDTVLRPFTRVLAPG